MPLYDSDPIHGQKTPDKASMARNEQERSLRTLAGGCNVHNHFFVEDLMPHLDYVPQRPYCPAAS